MKHEVSDEHGEFANARGNVQERMQLLMAQLNSEMQSSQGHGGRGPAGTAADCGSGTPKRIWAEPVVDPLHRTGDAELEATKSYQKDRFQQEMMIQMQGT